MSSPAPASFSLVVAATRQMGIGVQGRLPWTLPGDMRHFRRVTTRTRDPHAVNAVVMGRKTWESIPKRFRPLPKRLNVVLTSSPERLDGSSAGEGVRAAPSLRGALELASAEGAESVFVIGGERVFREALSPEYAAQLDRVYLTRVERDFECDVFFTGFREEDFEEESVSEAFEENGTPYRIAVLRPRPGAGAGSGGDSASPAPAPKAAPPAPDKAAAKGNHEEQQYLDLVRDIIENGALRADRTGTGTLSKFGTQMRFSLRDDTFPLLTTKRTFFRGVAEELLWFVSGSTNARVLRDKNVRIWEGNASREYLDSIGLTHREEGDLGPVYGFQWRHFGAEYTDMHADYTGQGVDQLAAAIDKIKTNPECRRIIVSAWNPADLGKMALPPCHMFCQFYVAGGELSCQMYQRSADMGLGVPFNIASYALLTRMVAQVCGLRAGEFVHTLGDAHVYTNHVEPLRVQLQRVPRAFPKLRINPDVRDIDGFTYSDFVVEGYDPYPAVKMAMAV